MWGVSWILSSGFLWVLGFPPLCHLGMISVNEINPNLNAISPVSNSTCVRLMLDVLCSFHTAVLWPRESACGRQFVIQSRYYHCYCFSISYSA